MRHTVVEPESFERVVIEESIGPIVRVMMFNACTFCPEYDKVVSDIIVPRDQNHNRDGSDLLHEVLICPFVVRCPIPRHT